MFICIIATALLNLVWPYLNGTILYDKVLAKDPQFLEFLNLPAGKYVTALLLVVLSMFMTKLTIQVFRHHSGGIKCQDHTWCGDEAENRRV